MPLSFPSSPTVNQTVTINSRQYRWTGNVWEFVSSGGGGGLSATVTIPGGGDPYWSQVVLLLPMDGSGNTFSDVSSSPKTVTANGNATQSTAQSKWGGKSAYFDGAGDSLSVPAIAFGTADFAIEMWFLSSSNTAYAQLLGNEVSGGGFTILLNNDSVGQVAVYVAGNLVVSSSSGDWTDGAWHHLLLSRSGSSFALYLDGTRMGTGTSSASFSSSSPVYIGNNNFISGRDYAGYIDDLRVTLNSNRGYVGASIPVPTREHATSIDLVVPVVSSGGGGSGLTWSSVPASATASGTAGQIAYDVSYFYVATGSSQWKRTALAAWAPVDSISGLQLWLDAADSSTLYDATSGGSLVAADAAAARWADKSGNSNHVTQSSSSARPLRRTAAVNGLAALEFDGVDDIMDAAGSVIPVGSDSRTLFVVYRPLRTTGSNTLAGVGASGGSGLWFRLQFRASPPGDPYFAGFAADLTDSSSPAQTVKVATITFNGTTGTLYRNGSQVNSAALSLNTTSAPFSVGGGSGEFANCYLCEVIVYNSALSSTDRAAVESYLIGKWGVS